MYVCICVTSIQLYHTNKVMNKETTKQRRRGKEEEINETVKR